MRDDVSRRLQTYRAALAAELAFMKAATTIEELVARSVPLAAGAGMLVPVCELHTADERLIGQLGRWHGESVTHVATWLRELLDAGDRIVFLVQDRFGLGTGAAAERREGVWWQSLG